jgi:hypothetical protein
MIQIKCKKHPRYQGRGFPRESCSACIVIRFLRQGLYKHAGFWLERVPADRYAVQP